jgi:very-short-patch-repair endonuclease
MRLNNLPKLKARRRVLRRSLTPAETRLWKYLQRSQLQGRKFRRQHSVGSYILDFYCPAEKLAVELDGAAHDHEAAFAMDERRSAWLLSAGIRVVRFENELVLKNLEGVLAEIARHFLTTP